MIRGRKALWHGMDDVRFREGLGKSDKIVTVDAVQAIRTAMRASIAVDHFHSLRSICFIYQSKSNRGLLLVMWFKTKI